MCSGWPRKEMASHDKRSARMWGYRSPNDVADGVTRGDRTIEGQSRVLSDEHLLGNRGDPV
jgi:hypothetical protein